MRVDNLTVELMLFWSGLISMGFYIVVGKWSDRVGRKKPIIIGALAALVLLFPAFWALGEPCQPRACRSGGAQRDHSDRSSNARPIPSPNCSTASRAIAARYSKR